VLNFTSQIPLHEEQFMNTISINTTYLQTILTQLIAHNSVNPSLVAAAAGEAHIARYVAQEMSALGLTVQTHEPAPGRVSVVGRLAGTGGGKSLLLNAHYDTVGVEGMADPFTARWENGRVYGRGVYDMKASLAAQLAAVKAVQEAGYTLRGDVLVAAVADEEFASLGTQSILPHYPVDGVIVTEPSELGLSVAHKGFIWLELTTFGRAFHGSRPDMGVDANMRMGRVLHLLDQLAQELQQRPGHPLLGAPSLHCATLHGGTEWSMYSAQCVLQIERRTVPGETESQVVAEIEALLGQLRAQDPTFQATLKTVLVRDPFEVDPQTELVQAVQAAGQKVLGRPLPIVGQTFWTDAAFHASTGTPTLLLGPAGHGAHALDEWVDWESVIQTAGILAESMVQFCG
jgi:acetylornithine deacetylase